MHRPLVPFTALATLLLAGTAGAAEWYHPAHPTSAGGTQGPVLSARAAAVSYLLQARSELRLDGVNLRFATELQAGPRRTVRFAQRHAGLPVIGGSAAVRLSPDGGVEVVVLDIARGLAVSPTPSLDETAARAAVAQAIGVTPAADAPMRLWILPDGEGPGRLVWSVDVRPSSPRAFRYLVDAHTGALAGGRPLAMDALGRVYPISSVNTPQTQDLPLSDLDVSTPQMLTGWSGNLTVTNYVSGGTMSNPVVEQTVVPNVPPDFLYDPPADPTDTTDEFAQVGIFYHLTRIRDYFASTHGVDFSPPSWKITAVANMQESGQPLDNAYFSPDGITGTFASPNLIAIGQGTTFDFAQDSDVFLHEFGHYVAANAIGYDEGQLATDSYGLSPWGGSIDEGTADYFACTLNGDSTLGEASLDLLGAVRELTDTSKRCPDDVFGEVHYDGEIIGSLSWSVRTLLGQTNGDAVIWGALQMLTTGSSFGDFSRGITTTVAGMVADGTLTAADAAAIDDMLATRGMDDCDKEMEVSETKSRNTTMFGLDLLSQVVGANCSTLKSAGITLQSLFHFYSEPLPSARGIRFTVDLQPSGGGQLDWGIYVRAKQHVGFSSGGLLPKPSAFDYSVDKLTDTHGEIVIDDTSTPPFDPAARYYMVVGHSNCPLVLATVKSGPAMDMGQGGAGGGGVGGAGGAGGTGGSDATPVKEESGCGCRVPGSGSTPAPMAALAGLSLLAAGALRRRARRPRRG